MDERLPGTVRVQGPEWPPGSPPRIPPPRRAPARGMARRPAGAGQLPVARRALLDEIGFPWDPKEARWTRRYRELADALARHGGPAGLPADSAGATRLEGQVLAHTRGKLPHRKTSPPAQGGLEVAHPDPPDH